MLKILTLLLPLLFLGCESLPSVNCPAPEPCPEPDPCIITVCPEPEPCPECETCEDDDDRDWRFWRKNRDRDWDDD